MTNPFLIGATTLLALLLSAFSCESANRAEASLGTTKEEIQRRLDERVRKNAMADEVLAVLDEAKVDHSNYLDPSNLDPRLLEELDRANAVGPTYLNTRRVEAIVRDVKKNLVVSESVQIIFLFDEHDKLIKYELRSIFTGP